MTHCTIVLTLLLMCMANGLAKTETQRKKLESHGSSPPSTTVARRSSGFYKEIFMSGGVRLSSRKRLHAAESLEMAYEYYAGKDKVKQNEIISGSEMDSNGALLYPDGRKILCILKVSF